MNFTLITTIVGTSVLHICCTWRGSNGSNGIGRYTCFLVRLQSVQQNSTCRININVPYLYELGHPLALKQPAYFCPGNNVQNFYFKLKFCLPLTKDKWTISLPNTNYCLVIVFHFFSNTNLSRININVGILTFLNTHPLEIEFSHRVPKFK